MAINESGFFPIGSGEETDFGNEVDLDLSQGTSECKVGDMPMGSNRPVS